MAVLLLLAASPAYAEIKPDGKLAAQARGLLHRWLAAQNSGDFDFYQALYAPGFCGVRRSGQRTVRLGLRDSLRSLGGGNSVGESSRTPESVEAFQDIDASKLPARFAREVGRRYHILDFAWPERAPCAVRVTHLRIWYRGRVETEYGAPQATAPPPLDLAADGQRLLVAEYAPDGECSCRSGLAYPANLPPPAVAQGEAMPLATHLQVLEAISGAGAQLPPGFPSQLDVLKARCRLLGAERFHAVEAGVASEILLHYAECEDRDAERASIQWGGGPSQRYTMAKTTRFWSLWSIQGGRLLLRDAGVDAQRLLGHGPWTGVDLNGDGRLDFFDPQRRPEWVGPGPLKSAIGDAALFSSGAGYTLGPRSVAPPPVLLWEPEPGC